MAHILMVEDSQSAATAQAICLREAGHRVDIAATGQAALKYVANTPIDLILLDFDLPDIDGFELFKKIQRHQFDTPVIMVTGRGDEKLAARIMRSGAKDYLIKSKTLLQNLKRAVERILEQERIRRELLSKDLELRQANAELEQKVAERTAELSRTNRQLEAEVLYRRRAEAAMYEANAKLIAVIDSIHTGLISIDANGIIEYWNSAMSLLFGLKSENLSGRSLYDVFPELKQTCPLDRLTAALSDNMPIYFEMYFWHKNRNVCFDVSLFPQTQGATMQFQQVDTRNNH